VVLQAHRTLLKQFPDLCLLLIPRHPERGADLAKMIVESGFLLAMRSRGETLAPDTQVYLADTLGETGTWYALADFVFLGGSLSDIGGHNPFEPAISGAAVITGPYVRNFAETYTPLIARGGAVEVSDAAQLADAVVRWLTDKDAADTAGDAAREFALSQQDGLDHVVDQLCHALNLAPSDA
jgi:3-deoxy-D-manno-octulosonic-acid transferase